MSPPSNKLTIRPARPSDAATLYRWDNMLHVKQATSNSGESGFDAEWDAELAPRSDGVEFFIAEVDSLPIGAMQVIDPATERSHYWGPVASGYRAIDIWIGEEQFLGCGHGTHMMTFAIDRCFDNDEVSAILIDPLANNTRAHTFYQRLGFQFVERRQFDEESDCHVYKLTRDDWTRRPASQT